MADPVTLRLWLAGPLQSWGSGSRFEVRATELAPTKSGVIGLLCAALGRPRDEPVDDLAALRFGVAVVRPGTVLRDFHTAGAGTDPVAVASGGPGRGIVTERFYLQDAAFVAGLEGSDRGLAEALAGAARSPRWLLGLGRRSCPPAGALVDDGALFDGPLEDALRQGWWPVPGEWGRASEAYVEVPDGEILLNDQPTGAAYRRRTFGPRRVRRIELAA